MLVIDAQLPATLVSSALLVLVFVHTAVSVTDVWLGFPLIYPINLFASLASSHALREDVEADAKAAETERRTSEGDDQTKTEIPPAEHRPSFVLAPFPIITLRRASEKLQQLASPVLVPAISGVRRASQLLGALPPIAPRMPAKKRTFPFRSKKADDFSRSPVRRTERVACVS